MSKREPKEPPILVVGTDARARAWAEAARARGAEVVELGELVGSVDAALARALEAHPEALVAVALPPRAALRAALFLAERARRALVAAPLHEALADTALPAGATLVQVAHGLVTLGGRAAFERVARGAARPERVSLEVRGLPDAADGDLDDVLVHALALARRCAPLRAEAPVREVRAVSASHVEVELAAPYPFALRVFTRGQRVDAHARGPFGEARWRAGDAEETLEHASPGKPPVRRAQPLRGAAARDVAQLLGEPGDSLVEAAEVARLARAVNRALPRRPPPRRALALARRIATERPDDVLAALGLEGTGALASGGALEPLPLLMPSEPIELWSFHAGAQEVAFLTVRPDDADATAALFPGAYVERRERKVEIDAFDRWNDRRDRGEARVELYVSRDAARAREAARLQAEGDPSAHLREMGELLGYPACCVEAFAAQADRADNTLNRYASAARTEGAGPWPWELNNLFELLVPFYPCSYECPHALTRARRAFAALAEAYPARAALLREHLARPVLYFAHERFVSFDGARAFAPRDASPAFARFAAALRGGGRVVLDDAALMLEPRESAPVRYARTDPSLGMLAPFGEQGAIYE